jgi:hypothetical protein
MSVHLFNSSQRCNYTRHNIQAKQIDTHVPEFSNRSSGVFTGLAVTTGGGGLSLRIAAGKALVNLSLKSPSLSTLSGANTTFNFVHVTSAGAIASVTMAAIPATFAILAVAQASGGVITNILDLRVRIGEYTLLAPGGATAWRISAITGGGLQLTSL